MSNHKTCNNTYNPKCQGYLIPLLHFHIKQVFEFIINALIYRSQLRQRKILRQFIPVISTGDEIEDMNKDAVEMADQLNVIIHDVGEVLGEMSRGNYAVRSRASGRYTGDFKKLFESMRGMRDQMKETLLSIGEASSHVSCGSGDLAKASQSLAEGATEPALALWFASSRI